MPSPKQLLTSPFHKNVTMKAFLHSFPSLQPQNQHPSSSSPQSNQSTVATESEPPIFPTLVIEHHYTVLDSSSILEISENSQEHIASAMNVADRGLAVIEGVHQRREAIVVDTELNRSAHPYCLTLLGTKILDFPLRLIPMVSTKSPVETFHVPVVGPFCFDPEGTRPVAYPSKWFLSHT